MNAKGGGGGRRSGSQSPGPAAAAILCQAPAGAAAAARPPRAAASHALPAAPQWRRPPSLPPSLPPFSPPPREGAGARTHLRQSEEDAGRLDELAAQDAQVGLALQVQAVLHGGSRREALLGDERVVDGERYLRVQPVTDKDTRGGGSRRGGDGSGGGGGGDGGGGSGSNGGGGGGGRVCGGGSHDGGARPHPQPATHRLARPGAVTQHTAAPARAARREKKVRRAPPRSPTIAAAPAEPGNREREPAGAAPLRYKANDAVAEPAPVHIAGDLRRELPPGGEARPCGDRLWQAREERRTRVGARLPPVGREAASTIHFFYSVFHCKRF